MSNFYKDVAPTCELSDGTKINISDVMELIPDIVDKGCKNLWNISDTTITTYTARGITFVNNGDSTFTVSGTSTDNDAYVNIVEYHSLPFGLQQGDTIVIASNSEIVKCALIPILRAGSPSGSMVYGTTIIGDVNKPGFWTISPPSGAYLEGFMLRLVVPKSGTVVDYETVSGMICKKQAWNISQQFIPVGDSNANLTSSVDTLYKQSTWQTVTSTARISALLHHAAQAQRIDDEQPGGVLALITIRTDVEKEYLIGIAHYKYQSYMTFNTIINNTIVEGAKSSYGTFEWSGGTPPYYVTVKFI